VAWRPANWLQGVALDGRAFPGSERSAMVELDSVRPGLSRDELPAVTIRFFDEQRSLLGTHFIGPFFGTRDWKEEKRVFRVPNASRFAIVSIGLLGGVGTASFDAVKLQPAKR